MHRQYRFRLLMLMLTSNKVFVMREGTGNREKFFFAQIVD